MLNIIGWVIATLLVTLIIGIHYEVILLASDVVMPWAIKRFHDRRVMLMTIMALMIGHIVEIWIFAVAMKAFIHYPVWGSLTGAFDGSLNDMLYFSAVSYTSIGFSDITPHGILRAICVSEALAGLLMIAWSASFTYLKMEQIWNRRRKST